MDLLKDKIKPIYLKYLSAAFGSALISSIYSVVDMSMVGQYQGPDGTAALAIVAPIWNIIYSLGLLMGIGGSVLLANLRGEDENNIEKSNQYFTTALIGVTVLSLISWVLIVLFDAQLLTLFGASEDLLSLARDYVLPIKFVIPCFLFNQMLAAFLRNDGDPALATKAVIFGGIFNVFGDYFFVFPCNMGIFGAGLATAMGSVFSLLLMLIHFKKKTNTLHLVKPTNILNKTKKICITGFSTFFIDVAMGILTILFNRQIQKYLGTNALSIYGIIINVSTFVQCCAYSIGQASQPIISINYGASNGERIKETLKYAIYTAIFFSIIWTFAVEVFPNAFVKLFMTPTDEILQLAPSIFRAYGLSFILLPLNIFSTYYFQAIMKPKTSFIVSIARGAIISGLLICVLPLLFSGSAIWYAMPITELITSAYVIYNMFTYTKQLAN